MACGRPVVVSRTAAIARGYHLEDGVNCRLVPPGDADALEHAVIGTLGDAGLSSGLGQRARETVERHLTWSRYADDVRRAHRGGLGAPGGPVRARSIAVRIMRAVGVVSREVGTEVDRVRYEAAWRR